MFHGKRFQFFLTYLFSYVFVLLLPLVTMGVFVQNYLIDVLKNEVIVNNLNSLNRVKYVIDKQVLQLHSTSNQLMYVNSNLRPFYLLNEDPLKSWKITKELQNYATTNQFIHEMMVYFRGEDRIYSNRSMYTLSMFSDNIYPYPEWRKEELYSDLNGLTEPLVRPAEILGDEGKFITFLFPTIKNSTTPFATVIFLVKEEAIHRVLEDAFRNYSGNTIVLNQRNHVITSLNSNGISTSELEQVTAGVPKSFEPLTRTIEWNGETHYVFSVKSSESGWTYMTTLPVAHVMAKVTKVQTGFVYGTIAILTLGAVVIYGSMNMNYRPLSQLKQYTENIWKQQAEPMNELETVRHTIDSLFIQNRVLNVKVESSYAAAKDYLLFQLLKGRFPGEAAFNEAGKEWGITISKPNIRIVIVYIHGDSGSHSDKGAAEEWRTKLESLDHSLPQGVEGYGRDHLDENKWVMVLSFDEDEETDLSDGLAAFHENVRHILQRSITMGVGNAVTDWREVPKSYFEAATAIDYRFIKGNGQVIYSKDIMIDQTTLEAYPHQEIAELKSAIKQANLHKIETLLQQLLLYMKQNNTPLLIARGLCFDLIHAVTQTTGDISLGGVLGTNEYPDVFLLEKYETVEEFVSLVKQICQDISDHLDQLEDKDNLDLHMQMKLYIKHNYTDREFSIQKMADYFGMAPPNLSQYFKERTGQTVLDFATQLRIDKAKQLLLSSTISIKYIAEETGYDNVSSFIRRFKQWTGKTPGEFRNQGEVV